MTNANTMLEKERLGRENRRLPADVNNVGTVLVDAAGTGTATQLLAGGLPGSFKAVKLEGCAVPGRSP